jgi:hypothetical protein
MLLQPHWPGLVLWFWVATAAAQGWERDRWHHVTEDSPFFAEGRPGHPGAAILQSDGRFAQIVLGDADEGALVSINMPVSDIASSLTSTLVMPDGNILVREVPQEDLVAVRAPDGESVTYSFGIASEDVDRFMTAQLWRVQAGDTLSTISLTGSLDAISAASAARKDAAGAAPDGG